MNNRGRGRGLFRGGRGRQGDGGGQGGGGGGNAFNNNNIGGRGGGGGGGAGYPNNNNVSNNHNNGGGGRGGRGRGGRGGVRGGRGGVRGNYRGFSGSNDRNGNGNGGGGGLVGGQGLHRTNFKRGSKSSRGSQANSGLRRGGHNAQQRFGNGGGGGGGWANGSETNSNRQGHERGQDQGCIIVFVKCKNKGQGGGQGVLGDPSLIAFLAEKALPTVIETNNRRYYDHKDQTSFLVGDMDQAKALRALSGIRYNSHKLVISTSVDGALNGASNRQGGGRQDDTTYSLSVVEAVRNFIHSRVNGNYLNLERMAADSILHDGHVTPPGQNHGYDDSGPLIFKIAAELYPEVTTISLGFNGLISLQSVSSLSLYFPDLLHLSLKGNNISSLEELQHIGGNDKLLLLEELVLKDNPVWEEEIKIMATGSDGSYKTAMSNLFPTLLILDDDKIERVKLGRDMRMQDLEFAKVALSIPIRGNYFDSTHTHSMVLEFLTRLFDTNREFLENVYSNDARFSCTALQSASSTPQQDNANGYQKGQWIQNTSVQRNVWAEYYSRSRNLKTTKDMNKVMSTLFVGNQEIVQNALSKLPRTRHDLSDDSKICVDALRGIPAMQRDYIFVSVHGEYEELRRGASCQPVRKSFDRTFILIEASLNSIAAQNGWKCLILSDHLTVREYNGSESWKPQPAKNTDPSLAAALDNTDSIVALRHPDGLSGMQHSMAEELMRHTGLTYQYSIQALVANGWNPEDTLIFIQTSLNKLPSHAWHSS